MDYLSETKNPTCLANKSLGYKIENMKSLFDVVTYDGNHFTDLKSQDERNELLELVAKLKPLETEIINSEKGKIMLSKAGNIIVEGFSETLKAEISKIIHA